MWLPSAWSLTQLLGPHSVKPKVERSENGQGLERPRPESPPGEHSAGFCPSFPSDMAVLSAPSTSRVRLLSYTPHSVLFFKVHISDLNDSSLECVSVLYMADPHCSAFPPLNCRWEDEFLNTAQSLQTVVKAIMAI